MTGERYLHRRILDEVRDDATVLDVGAGMAKYHDALVRKTRWVTMLDAHKPYLDDRARRYGDRVCIIHDDALVWMGANYERRFDVVLGIDVVEHLQWSEAIALIEWMRVLGRKVVLFIPEGDHPQRTDAHGMGGDHWQTHRSTWYGDSPGLEAFKVERWPSFHAGTPDKDPGALWCVWSL